jgi:hypothetical protein
MKSGLRMAVNPNTKRENNDFYATNPKALELFLDRHEVEKDVWEPSCGQGHLSKLLETRGYAVKSTDLIDRGYGTGGVDFLQCSEQVEGDILTNPPFNLAEEFVCKGMDLLKDGRQLILFLKIQFLEGQKRKKLFEKYPPKYVYCHSSRQLCSRNGDFETYNSTTLFYAWFVWEKGFTGEPIIRWI